MIRDSYKLFWYPLVKILLNFQHDKIHGVNVYKRISLQNLQSYCHLLAEMWWLLKEALLAHCPLGAARRPSVVVTALKGVRGHNQAPLPQPARHGHLRDGHSRRNKWEVRKRNPISREI